jgi:Skp family chaperone for outer membrane proteins
LKLLFMTLALVMLSLACPGGKLWAQPQAMPPNQAGLKVGIVNLGVLFRDQDRVKILKRELDVRVKPFENRRAELDKCINDWQKLLRDPANKLSEEMNNKGQKAINDCSHERQDLDEKCHKEIGEHLGAEMVFLDKEIRRTIGIYAEKHGYHLILAYGEGDKELPPMQEIVRRMTAIDEGYVSFMLPGGPQSIDITPGVLDLLNSSFRAGSGTKYK